MPSFLILLLNLNDNNGNMNLPELLFVLLMAHHQSRMKQTNYDINMEPVIAKVKASCLGWATFFSQVKLRFLWITTLLPWVLKATMPISATRLLQIKLCTFSTYVLSSWNCLTVVWMMWALCHRFWMILLISQTAHSKFRVVKHVLQATQLGIIILFRNDSKDTKWPF